MTPTEKQLTDAGIREGLEMAARTCRDSWFEPPDGGSGPTRDQQIALDRTEAAIRALIVPTDYVVVKQDRTYESGFAQAIAEVIAQHKIWENYETAQAEQMAVEGNSFMSAYKQTMARQHREYADVFRAMLGADDDPEGNAERFALAEAVLGGDEQP